MASVSVDDVRDVINFSSSEAPDATVLRMIKWAEVTLVKSKASRYDNY